MPRIVWTRRLLKLLAFALLVAVTCVALGIWQIARLHQKQQYNETVLAGLAADPEPFGSLVADGVDPEDLRYRRAEATGNYDAEGEIVLYGRSSDGQAGNHLLTPLVLSDGTGIIVDRGWVPVAVREPGDAIAAPPTGSVRVEGVLFPSETLHSGAVGSEAAVTTLAKIDLARIQAQLPYEIAPLYLLLRTQSPSQGALPVPATLPVLSEGPHLSYAIQWFMFAAVALIGFVILALREGADVSSAEDDRLR
jgi:cytochrome oxidase assembly protein ShyY1